jgi:hypothetical protein
LQKGVDKLGNKFLEWTEQHPQDATILLVDGNNLRGVGRFEWNFVELQERIACFCHDFNITKAVVVWDHGRCPFAWHKLYRSVDDGFYVDIVILFSGMTQRADDVLIAETKQLTTLFSAKIEDSTRHEDIPLKLSAMAFVTQDRELNYKLRRQANLLTETQHLDFQSGVSLSESAAILPLFCDSTRFLELLANSTKLAWKQDGSEDRILCALKETKESLIQFHKHQLRGYNPKREKTWERVVKAEVYRSVLEQQCRGDAFLNAESTQFVEKYLNDLETRGYSSTYSEDTKTNPWPFVGPLRLDKKQRRSLQRYNKFCRNCCISAWICS